MEERILGPAVLLCGFGPDARAAALRSWLRENSIRVIDVRQPDYDRPIGAVLDLPGFPDGAVPPSGGSADGEMLVMFGFRGGMLDALLGFFRREKLAPVALKAMATPTNLFWSARQLYHELSREHAMFERQKAARAAGNGG